MLFALVTAPVSAQQVYKCVNGGQSVYQSEPCAPGQTVKAWDAEPERFDPYKAAQVEAARQQLQQRQQTGIPRTVYRNGSSAPPVGAKVSIAKDDAKCQRARAHREKVLERVGLKRTYKLLDELDDQVWEACKDR
ncbi:MAG: DUF4124 domain-containing protein [Pseudomonas sp.]